MLLKSLFLAAAIFSLMIKSIADDLWVCPVCLVYGQFQKVARDRAGKPHLSGDRELKNKFCTTFLPFRKNCCPKCKRLPSVRVVFSGFFLCDEPLFSSHLLIGVVNG